MVTLAEKYRGSREFGKNRRIAHSSWPVASYNEQHATITTTTFTTKARRHEDFSTNERGNYSDNLFVERIADADWSTPPAGTTPMVNNLYQGMALDPVTGLYYERARWYSPSLGTWVSQDPLQYINGADTYQFVMGNPVGDVDPSGLISTRPPGPFPSDVLPTIPLSQLRGTFGWVPEKTGSQMHYGSWETVPGATKNTLFLDAKGCPMLQKWAEERRSKYLRTSFDFVRAGNLPAGPGADVTGIAGAITQSRIFGWGSAYLGYFDLINSLEQNYPDTKPSPFSKEVYEGIQTRWVKDGPPVPYPSP